MRLFVEGLTRSQECLKTCIPENMLDLAVLKCFKNKLDPCVQALKSSIADLVLTIDLQQHITVTVSVRSQHERSRKRVAKTCTLSS